MSSTSEEKIRPVDPARFHRALGIYQAALAAAAPAAGAGEAPSAADIPAIAASPPSKRNFPTPANSKA